MIYYNKKTNPSDIAYYSKLKSISTQLVINQSHSKNPQEIPTAL